MLGIIGGRSFFLMEIEVAEKKEVKTPFGEPSDHFTVGYMRGKEVTLLLRHGPQGIPPHRINHRANIFGMRELGVSKVIGVNSVGSLKEGIPPGWIVIPHDYISPWHVMTFYDHQAVHITPGLDKDLRRVLIRASDGVGVPFLKKGVYIQTIGPRLETKAEIAMLRNFGDVVGMTMAHEATLCQEGGIAYASICSVDNYCHGIGEKPLVEEEIIQRARENATQVNKVLLRVLEEMG
jgi:5'-methylthioadenosine phosphorylase